MISFRYELKITGNIITLRKEVINLNLNEIPHRHAVITDGIPDPSPTIVRIPISMITPNPSQPRKYFSDRALSALSDSIRRNGILQPLLVRPAGAGFELIAGERRLRAASAAGIYDVPCIIREDEPERSAELAIIENLQREDLNMFEEAEAIRNLIDTCSLTQETAAAHLSCSQSYIANKLRLLRLPEDQRSRLIEAGLTERHARSLLRIRDDDERNEAMSVIIKKHLNVAATEAYIENLLCVAERSAAAARASRIDRDLKRRIMMKDMRLFYNSIERAVESVRNCGISVETERTSVPDGTVISITVRNI